MDGIGDYKPLKLKGATSKSINLNQLGDLKKTNQNKSIFEGKIDLNQDGKIDENDILDKNGNGVIDGEEVGILQKFLDRLGGRDHKASAKDFHLKENGANQTAFNSLDKLAQQQIAKMNGQDYIEKDGDTTTTIKPNGMTIVETKDGDETKRTITHPDGARQEDSTVNGQTTTIAYPPGSDKPSNKIVNDQEGNILSSEFYEYNGEETTTHKYENGNAETGTLTGITVTGTKETISADGVLGLPEGEAEVTTNFKTEEDKTANKPESQTYTVDGKEYTVNYEYAEDGTITATIQTEGEEARTVKCKRGEDGKLETVDEEPQNTPENEQTEYTVQAGDNLWNIAKAQLGDGASAGDIANYVNKIMEANNLDWYDEAHTKVMIHPGDKLNLPATGQTEETEESEEVDNRPPEASEEADTSAQTTTEYNVQAGDNLWNIAKAQLGDGASAGDIANYVNKIMEANNLDWYDEAHTKVMIHPGDNLKLPATGEVEATEQVTTQPQVTPVQNDDLATVENPLTPEETARFDKALADAKDYLINNKEELGLTDAEIEIIQKAGTESIKYGAARADKASQSILFNYNTENREFDSGSFAKIMIHEATHMTINSKNNSVAEERQCETRALKCALKLLEKGLIEDQALPPNGTKLSELKDEEKLTAYIEEWLTAAEYRDRLPETAE